MEKKWLWQKKIEQKREKRDDWVGESLLRRVSATVALLLSVSVQAQDWVSRDGVTRRYTGGSELGFCPGKLLGSYRDFQRRHLASLWIRGKAYRGRFAVTVIC